jgi:hypothetical protein
MPKPPIVPPDSWPRRMSKLPAVSRRSGGSTRKFKDHRDIILSSTPASPLLARRFRTLAWISVIPFPGTFLHDSKRADW